MNSLVCRLNITFNRPTAHRRCKFKEWFNNLYFTHEATFQSTFMDIPNNTVLKTTINIRPNPIWKHSNTTPDCSAFVVHVLYNYTIGDSIIQKRAKLLLKQSKYKNEDVAICLSKNHNVVRCWITNKGLFCS